jgi:hypothetical protein
VPGPPLTIEQRRALQMLAASEWGCTEPALRRQGFTVGLLIGLVGTGYAVAETMVAAGKTFNFLRFVITDSGRQAIGS